MHRHGAMALTAEQAPIRRSVIIIFLVRLRTVLALIHQMPCTRPAPRQRRFLPHFAPGSMRCRFGPELVPPLPHAMMHVFPKSESNPTYETPSPMFSPIASSSRLIPKPSGEVTRISNGGYKLKDVLEQQHGWEHGLYDQIRV
jgi:hypothetical protein